MRYLGFVGLACFCLLTGCANAPINVTRIDQTDFTNPENGDRLHLGLHGPYTLTKAPIPIITTGHWDALSTPLQVITLDGRMPVRLSFHPGAKTPWQFVPLNMVGQSTIPPTQVNNYDPVQGQWFARKSDLQPAPDEQSMVSILSP